VYVRNRLSVTVSGRPLALVYWWNTFFTSSILRCTFPPASSIVPRSRKSEFPIALPAFSLTLPFTSLNAPLILSFVLDFIRRIARYVHSGCNLVWTSSRSADGEPKLRESPPPLKRQRSVQETAETFIAHSALPKLAVSHASLFLTLILPRPASETERMFTERRDAFSGSSGIPNRGQMVKDQSDSRGAHAFQSHCQRHRKRG
jgi:hypothetical protein